MNFNLNADKEDTATVDSKEENDENFNDAKAVDLDRRDSGEEKVILESKYDKIFTFFEYS